MKIFKKLTILIVALVLAGCADGDLPSNIAGDKPDDSDSNQHEWDFGETADLQIAGSSARRLLETLGTDIGLNVNEFESLAVNVELSSLSVTNPGSQQFYQGDLSIGWTSDGQFQEIRARAETVMMQASVKDCTWWRACKVLYTESNGAKRHSFGKGSSIRLMFEILDQYGADYDLMGGAFVFYGNERGDDGTMQGSVHYLPPNCQNGGAWINGRWYPCAEKSLHTHCWLLRGGPYQCATASTSPPFSVQHCSGGTKYDKNKEKYVCKGDQATRQYTRIGTFYGFNFLDSLNDYFASYGSQNSRGIASIDGKTQNQVWVLYILGGIFVLMILLSLVYKKKFFKKRKS